MRRFLTCLVLLMILTACGPAGGAGNNSATTPDLATAVPYQTVTPIATSTIIPASLKVTLPTPTTFAYTVKQGDTLNGIAQHYNVSLESLLAANPGIQPTVLPVGTKLVIPTGNEVQGEPTPSPAPLQVRQARCWPETSGGLWCFALVQNDYANILENLSAQFTILDSNGQELANQVVYGLLDILPPGTSMPLAAHFASPVQADVVVRVQVLTAIRLLPGDTRYLAVTVENTLVSMDASRRTAQVSGRVVLTGAGTANTLWVLATAYDASGNVVGVRRWDSTSTLTAHTLVNFDLLVSSVGPEISRVDFLAEARP
jgi:LysM repeat protein